LGDGVGFQHRVQIKKRELKRHYFHSKRGKGESRYAFFRRGKRGGAQKRKSADDIVFIEKPFVAKNQRTDVIN
jgi:hypothetical protein